MYSRFMHTMTVENVEYARKCCSTDSQPKNDYSAFHTEVCGANNFRIGLIEVTISTGTNFRGRKNLFHNVPQICKYFQKIYEIPFKLLLMIDIDMDFRSLYSVIGTFRTPRSNVPDSCMVIKDRKNM